VGRVVWAVAAFIVALGSKEASLALLAAPLLMYLSIRPVGSAVRALVATLIFGMAGAVFLAWYARQAFGSNGALMLDPLRSTADYLTRGPGRALLLLASWILQSNPFLSYFRDWMSPGRLFLAASGVVAVI